MGFAECITHLDPSLNAFTHACSPIIKQFHPHVGGVCRMCGVRRRPSSRCPTPGHAHVCPTWHAPLSEITHHVHLHRCACASIAELQRGLMTPHPPLKRLELLLYSLLWRPPVELTRGSSHAAPPSPRWRTRCAACCLLLDVPGVSTGKCAERRRSRRLGARTRSTGYQAFILNGRFRAARR